MVVEIKVNPNNDAAPQVMASLPYIVRMTLEGTSEILFHRWSNEAVAEKSKAAKGSAAKKTDDVESYVYRNADGFICIPGEYLRQTLVNAGRYRQDPRSPRKSAMDIIKAGVQSLTTLAPIMTKNGDDRWEARDKWDALDERRVTVQRAAITRQRPMFNAGWRADFEFSVSLPEYIDENFLRSLVDGGGKFVGLADMRPTYGRYHVVNWETGNIFDE